MDLGLCSVGSPSWVLIAPQRRSVRWWMGFLVENQAFRNSRALALSQGPGVVPIEWRLSLSVRMELTETSTGSPGGLVQQAIDKRVELDPATAKENQILNRNNSTEAGIPDQATRVST
eukprot:g19415.t1